MSEFDSIPSCFVCKVSFLSLDTLNYHLWHFHDKSTLQPVLNVTEVDHDLGTSLSLHSSFVETSHHEVDKSVLIVLTTGQNLCEEPQNEFQFNEISCTEQDCDQLQNEDHNTVQPLARDVYESIDCQKIVAQEINSRKPQRNKDDVDEPVLATESDLCEESEIIIHIDEGDRTFFQETFSTESNCNESQEELEDVNRTSFDEIQLQNKDHNAVQQRASDVHESIECPEIFAQEIDLGKHEKNVDNVDEPVLTTESGLCKELEIIDSDDSDWTSFNKTVSTESNGNEPQSTHHETVQKKRRIEFCDECQEMFSDEDKLKRHKIKVHGHEDKPILISESQLYTEPQNEMNDNTAQQRPRDVHESLECPKIFAQEINLRDHQRTESDLCKEIIDSDDGDWTSFNKTVRTESNGNEPQSTHNETVDKKRRIQFCNECPYMFSNEDMLKRHKLKVHHKSVQKLQVCHECQIFTQYRNLSRQKTDDKDEIFKCEKCLAVSQVLKKSYKCTHCSEAFSSLIKLVNHKNNVHWPIRLRV
ncbi:zinc finger protein 724-like [Trichogramma pretiosum]|uniref:zinc finger protein 724-like n=1 Tax=Trichogramma pretiosum TaxID=7493 RepID=UPI0006C9BFD3|nr:zinc finger protein 724-like [Trichogramma pretiosum]